MNSGRWWGTGRPGIPQSMGSQRAGHDLVTEQQDKAAGSSPAVFPNFVQKFSTKEPSSHKLSKMLTCIPSMCSMSEVAADPRSPIAEYASALPSPTSLPSWLCLPVSYTPAPVCQLLSWTTVLFKVLYYNIKNAFSIFVLFFLMYYLHE